MGNLDTRSNLGSDEAQEVQQRSEFIKRIKDFAQYMHKEYIAEDDGDLGLLLCAIDRDTDGKACLAHIMLGSKTAIAVSVASMMQQDGMDEIFRMAKISAGNMEADRQEAVALRRRLRFDYVFAGTSVFWTLILIGLGLCGMNSWFITVTNLLVMSFLGCLLWQNIRELRRRLEHIEKDEEDERRERERRLMSAFSAVFGKLLADRMKDDEED